MTKASRAGKDHSLKPLVSAVALTGHQSPTYHNNVFGFSVAYTNW